MDDLGVPLFLETPIWRLNQPPLKQYAQVKMASSSPKFGMKKNETTTQFSMKLKSQISVFTVASRPGKLIQKRKKSHRTTWSCWKSIKQIKKVLRKKKQACQRNFTTLLCFFRIFFSLKGWFGFKSQRFVSVEGWFRSRCHFVFGSLTPRDDAIYPGRIGI